ncbi:MAG: hypothetical protein CMF43_02075 [Legionellales bacterium]|nr:hypothetical protein [Legionellales bacterium]
MLSEDSVDALLNDSDTEDDALLAQSIDASSERLCQLIELKALLKNSFWQRAFNSSQRRRGFREELITFSENVSLDQPNQTIISDQAERLRRSFMINNTERCAINYTPEQMTDAEEAMRVYNASGKIPLDCPLFILGARGIHYYPAQWSAQASRSHRNLDERNQPLFSASLLHAQPSDTPNLLGAKLLPPSRQSARDVLLKKAVTMARFLTALKQSQPVIAQSVRYRSGYTYNSLAHALQDAYSNDLNVFTYQLMWFRRNYPSTWGAVFENPHNPNISVGLRIAHALKYAFGVKPYHGRAIFPGYDQYGKPLRQHVGKVYLTLLPVSALAAEPGPNHVSQMDYHGQLAVDDHISPEKELTFAGFLPSGCVVDHCVIKWPRFDQPWRPVHRIKYGLDAAMYHAFARLIANTRPNSAARHHVRKLLLEWLCVYRELLLIQMAIHHALKRGGFVYYLTRTGKLSLVPDIGRVFTGGDKYIQLRNHVHSARRLRLLVAQRILGRVAIPMPIIPCFWSQIRHELDRLYMERHSLRSLRLKIKHSRQEEGLIIADQVTEEGLFNRLMQTVFSSLTEQMPRLSQVLLSRQLVDLSVQVLLFKRLFIVGSWPYTVYPRVRYFHLMVHQGFINWMFQVFRYWHQHNQILGAHQFVHKNCVVSPRSVVYIDVFLALLLSAVRRETLPRICPNLVANSLFQTVFRHAGSQPLYAVV